MSKELNWNELYNLLHYDPLTGVFTWKGGRRGMRNNGVAGATDERGRRKITIHGRQYKTHRLAWFYAHKEWPKYAIDHVDGNPSNNALDNLRDVPLVDNQRNRKLSSTNTSGVCGVSWHRLRGKWKAEVTVGNRTKYLGLFDDFDDAVSARDQANKEIGFHENHGRIATVPVEWEEGHE